MFKNKSSLVHCCQLFGVGILQEQSRRSNVATLIFAILQERALFLVNDYIKLESGTAAYAAKDRVLQEADLQWNTKF